MEMKTMCLILPASKCHSYKRDGKQLEPDLKVHLVLGRINILVEMKMSA